MMHRHLIIWWFGLSLACGTDRSLLREADALQDRLEVARAQQDALRCAPGSLAQADANLVFMRHEVQQGDAFEARTHRDRIVSAMQAMDRQIEVCPPLDTDGDGIVDPEDRCPYLAGSTLLFGCPDADGDGLIDPDDQCPNEPEDIDGFEDQDGCPEIQDSDGDGLLDPEDRCPTEYGEISEQGCPKVDTDGDGIVDSLDLCPTEKEVDNGYLDDDGCPDRKLSLVRLDRDKGKIEISQKVYFATGKAVIRRRSYRLLREVAQLMKDTPELKVLVEGHTDARGSISVNLRLSQARADSVRRFLIRRGVAPERLTAIGFGEEKPVESNDTRDGRLANRRVEFTIVGD